MSTRPSSASPSLSPSPSPGLYIFTTSQTPLAVRYPRPRKPVLHLPALVHRSLHNALDGDSPSALFVAPPSAGPTSASACGSGSGTGSGSGSGSLIIPHPDGLVKHDLPSCPLHTTHFDANSTSTPHEPLSEINGEIAGTNGLSDASADYLVDSELTVKIHLVGTGTKIEDSTSSVETKLTWIKEALDMLEKYKGLNRQAIDTLLLGFKGVDYRGAKTAASEMFGCGTEGLEAPNTETIPQELEEEILAVWKQLFSSSSSSSLAKAGTGAILIGKDTRLGSLYAPLGLLRKLVELGAESRGVQVNALDTPDCHHLPKEYTTFAKERGVQLWAGGGGEGSDPLPAADLHNLLSEFAPRLHELSSSAFDSAKLEKPIGMREDGLKFDESVPRAVDIRWVLSYTLVSKTRNVLKDKGYIVAADLTA
ncbi:hypothetical protein IAU59_004085 [Kwoniella sp. CBS 9459]